MPSLPPDPHDIWLTPAPAEDPARRAKHALVADVKRAIEGTALLDVAAASAEELAEVQAMAVTLAERLESLPSLAAKGGPAAASPADAALEERSGISGRSNPLAPPMHVVYSEECTRGSAYYTDAYEGPPGCLHGGFVAAAFDDLMGLAQMASGSAGYTGTLTVRMVRPTPLRKRIDYEAWVDRRDGRKIWVKARSTAEDELLAEAEILFIAPRWGRPNEGGGLDSGTGPG